jgi:predicted nuclease with RNAse H fold
MSIIGLDLAGSEKRPTGFCILKQMKAETELLYSDQEIINRIQQVKPEIIAIDAPLSLPDGRKSIEERTNTHLRECDRELLKRKIKFFPITLGPMRKLTERGIKLKEILENMGYKVIEVYPGGAQDVLNIPRKQKGLDKLVKGLKKLKIIGLTDKMNDHELDAVTCAYVGKLFLEGKTLTFGNSDKAIIMPK